MFKPTLAVNPAAVALMALMAVTRFHHTGNAFALPDASLAIFFAAGLWIGGRYLFALLLAEAGLIDYMAISQLGVNDYCISPAYAFLLPAYAALWMAGKYCRSFSSVSLRNAGQQMAILAIATSVAFLISNSSYFLLSDKIVDKGMVNYLARALTYYPSYLKITVAYGMGLWAMAQAIKALWPVKSAKHAL